MEDTSYVKAEKSGYEVLLLRLAYRFKTGICQN